MSHVYPLEKEGAMPHGDLSAMGRRDCSEQRHGLRTAVLYLIALSALVSAFIVSGCAGGDEQEVRRADLVGSQEVPPVTTTATGTVTLTFSADRTRIDYQLGVVGPFSSNVRFAHIHIGPVGVNGSVVLFFCTNEAPPAGVPAPPACPASGATVTGSLTGANCIATSAAAVTSGTRASTFTDAVTQILVGNAYANMHTVTNPGGEIRGQLRE